MEGIVTNPRILVAPPGLTLEQVAFWDDVLGRMVKSREWLHLVEKHQWINHYVPSRNMPGHLAAEEKVHREILT